MTSVAIVTPTIGSKTLSKCIDSVLNQNYPNVIHHLFIDGSDKFNEVSEIAKTHFKSQFEKLRFNIIDENIGKGWYGHRVYAACSFLVNQDVIIYLDEDNWLEPNHIESMIEKLKTSDWAYSLRKIYDINEKYICDDDCESLGKWPTFHDKSAFHIDTSCFALKRDVAIRIGHSWYGQWGADRQFFHSLKNYFPNFSCTNQYTLCYRLGGNEGSVSQEFFLEGNKRQLEVYGSKNNFPWIGERNEIGPGIYLKV